MNCLSERWEQYNTFISYNMTEVVHLKSLSIEFWEKKLNV